MMFILGLIAGIVVMIGLLVIEIYLTKVSKNLGVAIRMVEDRLAPKGSVIEPQSDLESAREEIIRGNEEKGEDTPLEDVL
jgi:hypothetical protein